MYVLRVTWMPVFDAYNVRTLIVSYNCTVAILGGGAYVHILLLYSSRYLLDRPAASAKRASERDS